MLKLDDLISTLVKVLEPCGFALEEVSGAVAIVGGNPDTHHDAWAARAVMHDEEPSRY